MFVGVCKCLESLNKLKGKGISLYSVKNFDKILKKTTKKNKWK